MTGERSPILNEVQLLAIEAAMKPSLKVVAASTISPLAREQVDSYRVVKLLLDHIRAEAKGGRPPKAEDARPCVDEKFLEAVAVLREAYVEWQYEDVGRDQNSCWSCNWNSVRDATEGTALGHKPGCKVRAALDVIDATIPNAGAGKKKGNQI